MISVKVILHEIVFLFYQLYDHCCFCKTKSHRTCVYIYIYTISERCITPQHIKYSLETKTNDFEFYIYMFVCTYDKIFKPIYQWMIL